MKIEEYVERVESGNVQTKNSKVEKIMELIMIFFLVGFTCSKKKL
jgi:predicted transcriptional regulator